jgi:hypothetical protein
LPLYFSRPQIAPIVTALATGLAVVSAADALRLNNRPFARLYEKFLGAFMRESEKVLTRHCLPWHHTLTSCALAVYRKRSMVLYGTSWA